MNDAPKIDPFKSITLINDLLKTHSLDADTVESLKNLAQEYELLKLIRIIKQESNEN